VVKGLSRHIPPVGRNFRPFFFLVIVLQAHEDNAGKTKGPIFDASRRANHAPVQCHTVDIDQAGPCKRNDRT
jgi:hypothetical protein